MVLVHKLKQMEELDLDERRDGTDGGDQEQVYKHSHQQYYIS